MRFAQDRPKWDKQREGLWKTIMIMVKNLINN